MVDTIHFRRSLLSHLAMANRDLFHFFGVIEARQTNCYCQNCPHHFGPYPTMETDLWRPIIHPLFSHTFYQPNKNQKSATDTPRSLEVHLSGSFMTLFLPHF